MAKIILCVDDEKMILNSLKTQLKYLFGSKYIYETAENVIEAWEVIEEISDEKLDLLVIVSDWLMPGIKGDEFLVKVHKRFPDVVKILLTGQADEDAIKNARKNANLHTCLSKPWRENDLHKAIVSGLKDIKLDRKN